MIRRLIILLLIVGCEISEGDVDICVLKSGFYYTYCYKDVSEAICLDKADQDEFYYWGNDYTCAEGCENRKNDAIYDNVSLGTSEYFWKCFEDEHCISGCDN